MVLSRQLKKRRKFPTLLARQECRRRGALNDIFIEIYQNEIIVRKLEVLISTLDTHNVRTGGL
jgi:hypothetical protein